MEYESVYPWNVIDELKKGSDVYVTDRQQFEVISISCMKVEEFIKTLKKAETEKTRFDFWKMKGV